MVTSNVAYVSFVMTFLIGITASTPVDKEKIHLEKLSTVYLPYRYENNVGQFRYPSGAAEQTAYDPSQKTVYIVGGRVLHVLDIRDVYNPSILYWEQFDTGDLTDVEFCGDHLFVAIDNIENKENGAVRIYKKYDTTTKTLEMVNTITVGSLPDMIYPTSDCQTVIVAIEAEPYNNGSHFVDPEGAVGIIKFRSGFEGAYRYTKLDFRRFNDRWEELESRGVRFIYRENNNSFSNDVEPEYITLNENETVAYVSLQENNAIAEVDIVNENITDIHPLGFKNWTEFDFDASDKDQKINIRPWPVMGMYQPDSIQVIYIKGKPYLVTADEGDTKDYSNINGSGGFTEETRVSALTLNASSGVAQWASLNGYNNTLNKDENLGRLKVTNIEGRSGDVYNALYAYGGRGVSILDLNTFERVYDSGGDIEKMIAQQENELFNANGVDRNDIVSEMKDSRSDDKGPEVEDLAFAQIGDLMLLFVGIERPGFIAIYSIPGDISSIQFESVYTGIPRTNDTFGNLYDERVLSEKDPEDIRFISAQESPTYGCLLMSTGSLSGTLSIFNVKGVNPETSSMGTRAIEQVSMCNIGVMLLFSIIIFI